MNRDAMMQLGEYPKRFRILVLLKELFVIRSRLKKTSDSEMVKLPKMTDNSKEMALVFSRNLAIQGFYCDNNIEFLMGTIRALQITFQYGLSGYTSMSIIAYGLVSTNFCDFRFFYEYLFVRCSTPFYAFHFHTIDPEPVERSRRSTSRGPSRQEHPNKVRGQIPRIGFSLLRILFHRGMGCITREGT